MFTPNQELDLRTIAYFMALDGQRFRDPWVRGEENSTQWLADQLVCQMIDFSWSTGNLDGFEYFLDEFIEFCGTHLYDVQHELWRTGFDIKLVDKPCNAYKDVRFFGYPVHIFGIPIRRQVEAFHTLVTFTATKVIRTGDIPNFPITEDMKGFRYA